VSGADLTYDDISIFISLGLTVDNRRHDIYSVYDERDYYIMLELSLKSHMTPAAKLITGWMDELNDVRE